MLRVALVDGTTGEILWANMSGARSAFEDAGLSAMVDQVFKGFPK